MISEHKTHKMREPDDAPAGTLRLWLAVLVLKLDQLRTAPSTPRRRATSPADELLASEIAEIATGLDRRLPWWALPKGGSLGRVMHLFMLPLKAAIHLSVPDVHEPRYTRCYPLTLLLSVAWLAGLAFVMTLLLERVGCALNISSTVMGLTLGAIGTSFPNLYASILTARAGQGDQAICQAFGSNSFNVCIALGMVWLVETLAGSCAYGSYSSPHIEWCNGCFMPTGVLCPFFDAKGPELNAKGPELAAGSLAGTVVVCFGCFIVFIVALVTGRGHITRTAAVLFVSLYVVYVSYEVLAAYEVGNLGEEPVCLFGLCL